MHNQRNGRDEIGRDKERDLVGRDLLKEIEKDPEGERIAAEERAAAEAARIEQARIAEEAAELKQKRIDEERRRAAEKQELKTKRLLQETINVISQLKLIEKNINSKLNRSNEIKDAVSSYEHQIESLSSKKEPSQKTQQTIKEALEKIADMRISNNKINDHSVQIISHIQQLILHLQSTETAVQDKKLEAIKVTIKQLESESSAMDRGMSDINKLSQKIKVLNGSIEKAQTAVVATTPKSKKEPPISDDLLEIEAAIAQNALNKTIIDHDLEAFISLLRRGTTLTPPSIELALNHQNLRCLVYIIENEGISRCLNFINKPKKSSQDDYLHVLKYAIGIALFNSDKKGIDLRPEIQLQLEKLSKPQQRKILDFISDDISESLFGKILVADKIESLTYDFLFSLITNRADCTKEFFEKKISIKPIMEAISTLNSLEKLIMTARVTKIIGDLISETIDRESTVEVKAFMSYLTLAFSSVYEVNFNELITTLELHSPEVVAEADKTPTAEDGRIINYGECIHNTEMLQRLFLEALSIEPFKADIAIEILTLTKTLHSRFNLLESVSSFLEDKKAKGEPLSATIEDNLQIVKHSQSPATGIKVRGEDSASKVNKGAGARAGAGAGAEFSGVSVL